MEAVIDALVGNEEGETNYAAFAFICGLAACVLCLALFVIWESGPCHRSRFVEQCFIMFVWLLFLTSVVLGVCLSGSQYAGENNFETVFRVLIFALILLIALGDIMPGPPKPFVYECFHQSQNGSISPESRRVSLVLQEVLRETKEYWHPPRSSRLQSIAGPLAVLLILIEVVAEETTSSRLVARAFIIVALAYNFRKFSKRCFRELCTKRRCSKHVHNIFVASMPNLKKEEVEYIFLSVNIAQVVELASSVTLQQICCLTNNPTALSTAVLLDALMKRSPGSMRWNPGLQTLVRDLIRSIKGEELTVMKNIVDSAGGFHSMHHLVYAKIANAQIQNEILAHIQEQAKTANEMLESKLPRLKILSDVDDTLFCGGRFPAGCDGRFPRHAIYPGVCEFYRQLDKLPEGCPEMVVSFKDKVSFNNNNVKDNAPVSAKEPADIVPTPPTSESFSEQVGLVPEQVPILRTAPRASLAEMMQHLVKDSANMRAKSIGNPSSPTAADMTPSFGMEGGSPSARICLAPATANLVFLTARPHVYKDASEEKSFNKLRALVRSGQLHVEPQLLSGNLKSSLCAVLCYPCLCSASWRAVGLRKNATFEQYAQLYPEYDFVFCGDNGQGDLLAAESMVDGPYGDRVLAVFIQEVKARGRMLSSRNVYSSQGNGANGKVFFHFTYLRAAVDAVNVGLLDTEALYKVGTSAYSELRDMHLLHHSWNGDEVTRQFNEDVRAANELLPKDLLLPEAEFLPHDRSHSVASIFSETKVQPE